MIAALDVHYFTEKANAAAVVFENWNSIEEVARYTAQEAVAAAYKPGQFYARELSPLLGVIARIQYKIDAYIVDGYCELSPENAPGLGAHLHEALGRSAIIVGVAKNRFRQSTHAIEVFRAKSKRPLFVTAIGIESETAARIIAAMPGNFRIPDMLKAVDRLSRATG